MVFSLATSRTNHSNRKLENSESKVLIVFFYSYFRECNNRGKVFDVFNEFYAGVFYRVYKVWKNQRKTISDSGFVLREVEKYCKNHTSEVLRDFATAVLEKKPAVKHEESSAFSRSGSEKVESFSGVCDIQEREEEDVHLV